MLLGGGGTGVLLPRSGSALLAGLQTGFGAIVLGDAGLLAFLARAVRRGGFWIGGTWLSAPAICGDCFDVSVGLAVRAFWGCVLFPPCDLRFLPCGAFFKVVSRHPGTDCTPLKLC